MGRLLTLLSSGAPLPDPGLRWSILASQPTVPEASGPATVTVSYTGPLAEAETATIRVATADGTALAAGGADYTALDTVLTFTGGAATAQTVTIAITDDTVVEEDKTFSVALSEASAGKIRRRAVDKLIGDDDDTRLLWDLTGSTQVAEGDVASYTVSYSGATLDTGITATATVTSSSGTALDTGKGDGDFTGLDEVLTFSGGGVTSQTVSLQTIQDTEIEGTEDFTVAMTASIGAPAATITTAIVDDDGGEESATWDPTVSTSNSIFSNGDRTVTLTPDTDGAAFGRIAGAATTGKKYLQAKIESLSEAPSGYDVAVGFANDETDLTALPTDQSYLIGDGSHAASATIAFASNPANGKIATLDGKVYTFQDSLTDVDGHILIGASAAETMTNFANATYGGDGTTSAASTTAHPTLRAIDQEDGSADVEAQSIGDAGNDIELSTDVAGATFGSMTGGTYSTMWGISDGVTVNSFDGNTTSATDVVWDAPADVLGIAVDIDARKMWIQDVNGWVSGDPEAGTEPSIEGFGIGDGLTVAFMVRGFQGYAFGGRLTLLNGPDFTLTPPAGFDVW